MIKKSIVLILVIALVATLSVGCGGGKDKQGGEEVKPVHLKMNITVSENSSWYEGAKYFSEKIKERTNGKYIVDIYPSEQLSGGNLAKGLEMVQNGATDVDIHSTIIYTVLDPKFTVINMPWLIPSYEEADAALAGKGGEMIFDLIRSKGIVPLAFGESGYRQVTNNKRPIKTPEDLKGLKMRIPTIKMYISLFKQFGADPTAMNFSEVFTALQQGTIDGQENPLDVITSAKLEEVQKYITMWNYSYDALVLSVSQRTWDMLNDDEKKIFEQTAKEAMDLQKQKAREINSNNEKYLATKMEIYKPTTEELAAFKEVAKPVYDEYKEILGTELLEAFGYKE